MNFSREPENQKLTEQEKNARTELKHALSFHLQGNKTGALKSFRRALTLDANLAQDNLAANLATELTGLPAREAFAFLANEAASKELIKKAKKQDRETPVQPSGISTYFLGVFFVVFLGMLAWGFAIGAFTPYVNSLRALRLENQKHTLGGYEYYAIVPSGEAPAGGWNVVVAFHGYGGRGQDMLSLADTFTNANAIFVAPTFGGYAPNPGDGPIASMSLILKEVGKAHPIQSRGAVLFGLSQGGSFAYRFSVRYPEQVYGVVTAGAPEYDATVPARASMPYVFTWGELDGLQNFVIPTNVSPLQNGGYNIKTYIVPGYGHEVTPLSIEQTLSMIR